MFGDIYRGRKVLVTGHTGFKGSWLCAWLRELGAIVCGISLPLTTEFVHSDLLHTEMRSEICDITDLSQLLQIFANFQPEIVFHLAAQPIVRLSYAQPVQTFASNVMGTVHVLEACRQTSSVRAVVAISSDKCYENREQRCGYREEDPLGGYDPYSASKGCTELVIASYRNSFFNNAVFGTSHRTLLASARAGNVIGGGDWAPDRLVPDLMRAAAQGKITAIRNPQATRPWQFVLEPLSGYLQLGQKLWEGCPEFAEAWNFGPDIQATITVGEAAQALAHCWNAIKYEVRISATQPHEAHLLCLDCTKALKKLHWHGALTSEMAFNLTATWYRQFYDSGEILTLSQIEQYIAAGREANLEWTM